MTGLLNDLRHALRLYASTPVASAIAVSVLAVAIACVSAFVSLYSDLALKGHPGFERSDELISIGQSDGTRFRPVSPELLNRIEDEAGLLEAVAGVRIVRSTVGSSREAVTAEHVTRGYFPGLRPRLASGRGFVDSEHTADGEPVVVISHRFWRQQLDGRTDALGESISIGGDAGSTGRDHRIVGIMGSEHTGTFGSETAFWRPAEQLENVPGVHSVTGFSGAIGRVRDEATRASVIAELDARYGGGGTAPGMEPGHRLHALRGVARDINVQRTVERQVRLFLGTSILLALVAACNVSLFLLSRAPGRKRELAIRMAVGAPLQRMGRQLATEAAALVCVASLLGVLVSGWLVVLLQELPFLAPSEWRDVGLDWRVAVVVLAVALVATAVIALAPVAGLRNLRIDAATRAVVARALPAQRIAGAVQMTIAGGVGAAAIAFALYLAWLEDSRGYEPEGVHVVILESHLFSDPSDFDSEVAPAAIAIERARRREAVLSLPGIEAAAFGMMVPGMDSVGGGVVLRPDTGERLRVAMTSIDHAYVDVLGIRLLHGRAPQASDSHAVLVNEALAHVLWGRTNVAGEVLSGPRSGEEMEVIAVVEDFSFRHPAETAEPMAFEVGESIQALFSDHLLIRSSLSTTELRPMLDSLFSSGELNARMASLTRLDELSDAFVAADRARTAISMGTALLVLVLAGFGLYSTQNHLVSQGQREYAVRAALGAGPRSLGWLVIRRGMALALPGLVLGTLSAFILVAWLRDDFVSVDVSPAAVSFWVAIGLFGLAFAASLVPARHARAVSPAEQLREE